MFITNDNKYMELMAFRQACINRRLLEKNDNIKNEDIFNLKTLNNTKDNVFDEKTSDKEYDVLRGISIDKKNCLYKKETYNNGEWMNQFDNIVSDIKFNINTKSK